MVDDFSVIANPNGASWGFSQAVFEYLIKKEQEDAQKEKQRFLLKIREGLGREFLDNLREDNLRLGSVLYDALKDVPQSHFVLNPLNITDFADEEYRALIQENIRGSNCFFIHDSNLRPADWHSQLDFTDNALRNSSANRIINIMPYLKFSRQDRKDISRTSINAQAIARISVFYNAGVLTVDVHNKAIQGFYSGPSYSESFDSLESFPTLLRHLKDNHPELLENLVVVCPDEGASKRVGDYVVKYGFDIATIDKYRNKRTGKLVIRGICGDVSGKHALIPDDIGASGDTQIASAKIAREKGALSTTGYVTFGLFTKGIERVASEVDLLLIGDIIVQPYMKRLYSPDKPFVMPRNAEYVSFVPLIGEATYRISTKKSLSALFE